MDTLCQRCQTLILDDAAISGAHVRVNPDSGLEYLAINEEDGIDEIPTGYQWEDIVPDFPLLRKASEAACYCCQFLRETFVDTLNENFPRTPSAKVAITATYVWGVENHIKVARDEGTLERGLVALRFDMCLVHQSTPQFTVYFDIDSSVQSCINWLRVWKSPNAHKLCEPNVNWIKKHHRSRRSLEASNDPRDADFVPRRLIELKVVGDQVSARLVESDGIGSLDLVNIEYAALSYCWGSPEQAKFQTKLTRKTRPKMLSSIDTTATTPVIQDAIHVCKALNIRYLWVDAVCILQDEITDWTQQSAIMTTIFGNASITICPLSSRSCNEGFLAQVLSGLQLSFDSTIKREVRGHYTLRRSHFKDDFHRATLGDLGLGDLEMSSWQTRAWTFQEGNCSNFKIIFGERRIHIVTPQGMLTDGSDQVLSTARSTLADMKNGIYGKNLIVSNNQLYRYWENSVENFSSRQLTYRTDKFPALSGMASYYQEWLGDKLIAGLWERHLYRQLFWTKGKNKCDSLEELVETLCPLSSSWIAPSWSWASFDGYVEFSSYGFPVEELFTGHTSHCQALVPEISLYGGGGHSLGRLEAASLLVTSKVFSTKSSLVADVEEQAYLPNRQWKVQRDGERLRIAFELDWEDETDFDGHDLELLLLGSCLKKDECAYGESWSELDEPFSSADEAGGKTHVWGLVICPAPSDSRASRIGPRDYYRIGVFFFESGSNGSLGLFDTAQEATVRLL